MNSNHETHGPHRTQAPRFGRGWVALAGFAAMAGFFLWTEHRAHLLGALPWLILLACPFLHLFMHQGGHGRHSDGRGDHGA